MAELNQVKNSKEICRDNPTYAIICEEGQNSGMSFSQKAYVNKYNKDNYKSFLFRVKKTDKGVVEKLDNVESINKYIYDLIIQDIGTDILTIEEIKRRTLPVFQSHNIKEVYLFGSYARGEATRKSDVDFYFESGDIKSLLDHAGVDIELEKALGKKVDSITIGSKMDPWFKKQLDLDKIKLW